MLTAVGSVLTVLLACVFVVVTTADTLACPDGCTDDAPAQESSPQALSACAICHGWSHAPLTLATRPAARPVGRARRFINAENLTDARQTRWDPLLRPSRAVDGRWTVDAWAPLDGRAINGGVRLGF